MTSHAGSPPSSRTGTTGPCSRRISRKSSSVSPAKRGPYSGTAPSICGSCAVTRHSSRRWTVRSSSRALGEPQDRRFSLHHVCHPRDTDRLKTGPVARRTAILDLDQSHRPCFPRLTDLFTKCPDPWLFSARCAVTALLGLPRDRRHMAVISMTPEVTDRKSSRPKHAKAGRELQRVVNHPVAH